MRGWSTLGVRIVLTRKLPGVCRYECLQRVLVGDVNLSQQQKQW